MVNDRDEIRYNVHVVIIDCRRSSFEISPAGRRYDTHTHRLTRSNRLLAGTVSPSFRNAIFNYVVKNARNHWYRSIVVTMTSWFIVENCAFLCDSEKRMTCVLLVSGVIPTDFLYGIEQCDPWIVFFYFLLYTTV